MPSQLFKTSNDRLPLAFNNALSFPDVTVKLTNTFTTIHCHKVFLSMKSNGFKVQLQENASTGSLEINCEGRSYGDDELFAMISTFYHGELSDERIQSDIQIARLMICCDDYEASECHDACVKYLKVNSSIDTCLQMIQLLESNGEWSEKYQKIIEQNFNYVARNFTSVVKSNSLFVEIDLSLLKRILLQGDRLNAKSSDIVDAVFEWMNHDLQKRSKHAYELLKLSNIEDFSTEGLYVLLYANKSTGGHSWLLNIPEVVSYVNEILMDRVATLQGLHLH